MLALIRRNLPRLTGRSRGQSMVELALAAIGTGPPFVRRHTSRGQSLVELALILPVMLLLLATAIDLGRITYSQVTITNAAKEGALIASQGGSFQANQGCSDTNTVMCGVLTEAAGGFVEVDRARVALSPAVCEANAMYPSSGVPPTVTISVQAPFRLLTPVIGDLIGYNLLLGSTAEATCMTVPQVTYPQVPAPVAAFTASPTAGTAPLTVNVDASASTSAGPPITSYVWSFGATGVTASHTFPGAGTFTITLTVTNSLGASDTATQTITVTGGTGPTCPTLDVVATDRSNPGNPHRMNLAAVLTPSSSGWTFAWTFAWPGSTPASGASVNNVAFPGSGPYDVSVTATKGACVVPYTETVIAP